MRTLIHRTHSGDCIYSKCHDRLTLHDSEIKNVTCRSCLTDLLSEINTRHKIERDEVQAQLAKTLVTKPSPIHIRQLGFVLCGKSDGEAINCNSPRKFLTDISTVTCKECLSFSIERDEEELREVRVRIEVARTQRRIV